MERVFWSGFGADFVCAEHAPTKRAAFAKIDSHYEHRSCFHMRRLPRRLMYACRRVKQVETAILVGG